MAWVFTPHFLTPPVSLSTLVVPCLSGRGPFRQPQFPLLYSWPFHQYAMPPLIANVSLSLLSGLLGQKLIIFLVSVVTVYLSLSLSFLLPLENNFSGLSILFVGFSLFSLLSLFLGSMWESCWFDEAEKCSLALWLVPGLWSSEVLLSLHFLPLSETEGAIVGDFPSSF